MARFRRRAVRPLPAISRRAVLVAALAAVSCSAFSDPAVRLRTCIERAGRRIVETSAGTGSATVTCDLRSREAYTLVLHPARELAVVEMEAAGLSRARIGELLRLRLGTGIGVYVLPDGDLTYPSFTGLDWRFAVVPELLVVHKPAYVPVEVTLREGAYGVAVVDLR